MADTAHAEEHHGGNIQSYLIVAGALAVCTISSFFFNGLQQSGSIGTTTSFLLILIVAIIKASLVGWIFMHLKWDWKILYFLLVPAFILGTMMMIVLLPDAFLGPTRDAEEAYQIATNERP